MQLTDVAELTQSVTLVHTQCGTKNQLLFVAGAAVSPDLSVSPKLGKRKGGDEADHVWAGSFLACWGSDNLDHSDLPAAAAMKRGIVESDSNLNRPQVMA